MVNKDDNDEYSSSRTERQITRSRSLSRKRISLSRLASCDDVSDVILCYDLACISQNTDRHDSCQEVYIFMYTVSV